MLSRESQALEESEGDGAITFKTLDRAWLHAGISNSFLELLLMCFSFFRADVWPDGTLLYHFDGYRLLPEEILSETGR
jgi:hypothetical protein